MKSIGHRAPGVLSVLEQRRQWNWLSVHLEEAANNTNSGFLRLVFLTLGMSSGGLKTGENTSFRLGKVSLH